jgi:hypothetical protein
VIALAVRDTPEPLLGDVCAPALGAPKPSTLMKAIKIKARLQWACNLAQKGKGLVFERMSFSFGWYPLVY